MKITMLHLVEKSKPNGRIRKYWYYVDADGKMVTGFQTISGVKYYFETNGLMKKGWFVVDGTDYYASTSGEIKAQW